ncbi:hypothetical protein HAX54_019116 [Datura stramonium]|uniref:TF-B3 domain-containing protein n=1 Tax=Datura stramonium TaxID=4076 RepID=A0ABS8UQS9_DATST|nr:hypothetical protein [Datura stramonium]
MRFWYRVGADAHSDYSVLPFELNNTIWSTRRTKAHSDTFVQKHGDELLDTVKLIVPTDDYWCVGVKKAGQMIWLHDGWQEFMEHHSVGYWYILLFKYGQNSCFNVHIFDLAATEIDCRLRSHGPDKLRDVGQDHPHGNEKIVGDKNGEEIVDPLNPEQGPESSPKSYELLHGAKRQ